MKKAILGLVFMGLTAQAANSIRPETKVYICVSSSASVYHQTKDCRGLNNCTHTIKSITVSEAVNEYGRRRCKVCY